MLCSTSARSASRTVGAALRAAFGGRWRFAPPWGAFGAPNGPRGAPDPENYEEAPPDLVNYEAFGAGAPQNPVNYEGLGTKAPQTL